MWGKRVKGISRCIYEHSSHVKWLRFRPRVLLFSSPCRLTSVKTSRQRILRIPASEAISPIANGLFLFSCRVRKRSSCLLPGPPSPRPQPSCRKPPRGYWTAQRSLCTIVVRSAVLLAYDVSWVIHVIIARLAWFPRQESCQSMP